MLKKSSCLLLLCSLILLALSSNAGARENKLFQKIVGRWEGTLEYSDYKTEKRVKLKTNLTIVRDGANSVRFLYLYDDFGKVMKSESAHRIAESSKKYFIENDVYSFEEKDNQMILLGEQLDNDRLEPVRLTMTFGPDTLTILKETRTPLTFRNQYTFKRAATFEPVKTLSPAGMSEDFSIFRRAVLQLHPGLYRYNTPAEIEKSFNEIESRLKTPLSESEFFKLLSQFASGLRCGHTYLNPLNQTKSVRARLFDRRIHFPFYFRLIDRHMIVTGNLSSKKLAAGSEITTINGVAVEKIINELLSITTADGKNTLASRLKSLELHIARENQYQPFDIYLPLFFPLKDEVFEVEAIDYETKKATKFQVLAMTRAERFAGTEKRFGKLPTYDDEWNFEIRNDSIAVLKIGNSLTWRLKTIDYKKFLADAFAEMRVKNIRNLIIDWRGNDGGDDDLYVEIVKHLANKSVPCARLKTRFVRVFRPDKDLSNYIEVFDKQMREFLVTGVPTNLIGKRGDDGLYEFLSDGQCESVEPALNNFKGNAYVISDASNASAAFEFVRAVKENNLATIVGEETGGNLQGINGGNYFLLRLPNSTFEIDIPVYFQTPPTPQKDSGVIPDYQIKRSVYDIANGVDAELNYIIQKISK